MNIPTHGNLHSMRLQIIKLLVNEKNGNIRNDDDNAVSICSRNTKDLFPTSSSFRY